MERSVIRFGEERRDGQLLPARNMRSRATRLVVNSPFERAPRTTSMEGESSSGATRPPLVTAVPLDSRVIGVIIAGLTERLRGGSATGETTTARGEAPTDTKPAEARDGPGPRER